MKSIVGWLAGMYVKWQFDGIESLSINMMSWICIVQVVREEWTRYPLSHCSLAKFLIHQVTESGIMTTIMTHLVCTIRAKVVTHVMTLVMTQLSLYSSEVACIDKVNWIYGEIYGEVYR